MKFQWVREGMNTITSSSVLSALLAGSGLDLALVTTDPFTYDFNMVTGDIAYSTATGLTPQTLDTLTLLGPFANATPPDLFYKFLGVDYHNTSGSDQVITGVALRLTAGPVLEGVLIFDDPVTVLDDGHLTLDVLIGIGQAAEESTLEVLDAV